MAKASAPHSDLVALSKAIHREMKAARQQKGLQIPKGGAMGTTVSSPVQRNPLPTYTQRGESAKPIYEQQSAAPSTLESKPRRSLDLTSFLMPM